MRFVVTVGRSALRPQCHHRIGVALVQTAQGQAHQGHGTTWLRKMRLQAGPVPFWQMAWQQGNSGLRGHHQGLLAGTQLRVVPLQRIAHATGSLELVGLRNIGLQQLHLPQTCRAGEHRSESLQSPCREPHTQQGPERPQAPARQRQTHRQPSRDGPHAVHADPWREGHQGAVDMRITPGAPRKTGQPLPTHEFGQSP